MYLSFALAHPRTRLTVGRKTIKPYSHHVLNLFQFVTAQNLDYFGAEFKYTFLKVQLKYTQPWTESLQSLSNLTVHNPCIEH